MAFWIIIGLIVASWVTAIVVPRVSRYYAFWETSSAAGLATVIIAVIGTFVLLIGAGSTADQAPEMSSRYDLRALVTKEATETHGEAVFFLGFGYASSDTTEVTSISYIQTAEDGGNTIRKVDINDSVIYEDLTSNEAPYVENWTERFTTNGWWIPWTATWTSYSTEHRFHIPDGSIYEGYEVNP